MKKGSDYSKIINNTYYLILLLLLLLLLCCLLFTLPTILFEDCSCRSVTAPAPLAISVEGQLCVFSLSLSLSLQVAQVGERFKCLILLLTDQMSFESVHVL